MSGMEAFGAAATIFTFIDYGIKLINKANAVYKGGHELLGLQLMVTEFQKSNDAFIKNFNLLSTGPESGEALLARTAEQCQEAATGLLQLLNELGLKDGEPRRRTALKIAFKSEIKKSAIMEKKLHFQTLETQCQHQLVQLMSQQQYALGHTLESIEHRLAELDSAQARRLTTLKNEIIVSYQKGKPPELQRLWDAHKLATVGLPQETILSSLRYPEMGLREDRIESPSHLTFNWIFETATGPSSSAIDSSLPAIRYIPWLEAGKGIFRVTGKPASGKSTLMKFICNQIRTQRALERWASGRELLIASHYFWYSGSELERSYKGLLRSIIYKTLRKCPDLVEWVCEDRWRDFLGGRYTDANDWTLTELLRCLDKLVATDLKVGPRNICFCFFIDGLDEYDGGHEVVDALSRLARSKHTKICASSRPHNMFKVGFETSKLAGDFLELHRYTKDDIAKVVNGELRRTLAMTRRAEQDWKPLINEVINRSEGVFLWVILVIKKELRPMLEARQSLRSLLERLDTIPSNLTEYFQRIFDRMWADTKHRRDTARIFKSCIAADEPLPLTTIGVLTEPAPYVLGLSKGFDAEYALDDAGHELQTTRPRIDKRSTWNDDPEDVETARYQIDYKCQDLLEVHVPKKPFSRASPEDYGRIVFLHKSVRDFFDEAKTISQDLESYAGSDFDVHLTLSACYAFLVKKAATILGNSKSNEGHRTDTAVATTWSTRCLLHLRKAHPDRSVRSLLSELDDAMRVVYKNYDHHWSNYVDTAHAQNETIDRGSRDLLGHLIEFGFVAYVDTATLSNSTALRAKKGRPYLDYALRHDSSATYRQEAPGRTLLFTDPRMVSLLLERRCNVNQIVSIFNSRTVFDLYLRFLYDTHAGDETSRKITWLLIKHGAQSVEGIVQTTVHSHESHGTTTRYRQKKYRTTKTRESHTISMKAMLRKCFGDDEARSMCEYIAKNDAAGTWLGWASSLLWG